MGLWRIVAVIALMCPAALGQVTAPAGGGAAEGVRDWRYVLTIHEIAAADDDARLSQLLTDNPDRALLRTANGETAAHAAANAGAIKSLRVLAKAGANLNESDNARRTPLSIAVGRHYTNTVKALIELGADVSVAGLATNEAGGGAETVVQLPLITAGTRGYADIVKLLIEAKADVNRAGPDGHTAFTAAARRGWTEVMKQLLASGAQVDTAGPDRLTALQFAAQQGQLEVLKALIEAKADVNRRTPNGQTPLTLAARQGSLEALKALIDAGANVNHRTPDDQTALTAAAVAGRWDVVTMLLEARADVNAMDREGRTALMQAVSGSNQQMVNTLLERGSNARIRDRQGRSLLGLTQSPAIWRLLVAKGADVNTLLDGATPLQRFITQGNLTLVRAWLEYGPDPMVTDRQGQTAKELAARGADGSENRREIARLVTDYQKKYVEELETKYAEAERRAAALTNAEIKWDGNWVGLNPQVEGENAKALLAVGRTSVPMLVSALEDPRRFAAAHVLLTQIFAVPMSGTSQEMASRYNGLRVGLAANGTATIPEEQMAEILQQWRTFEGLGQ